MARTKDWLRDKMTAHGLRPSEVARILDTDRQTVNKILNQGRRITAEELVKLQSHFANLEAGGGPQVRTSTHLPAPAAPPRRLAQEPHVKLVSVVGEVQAGAWKDVTLADFTEYEIPTIVRDARWPEDALRAMVVRGESANRIVRDGEHVIILDLHEAPRDFHEGDWVVVEREELGRVETTVKKVGVDPQTGRWLLLPDSDHPAHQEPILFDDGNPNVTVRVRAFVLDVIKNVTRL